MGQRFTVVSAYQIMWVWALFDLPVTTASERKRATRFRKDLLDMGFEMVQFSVYTRFAASKRRAEALARQVGMLVPPDGKVDVLFFTDRQYELIQTYRGQSSRTNRAKPAQLDLF